jgi:hypothetical protein
MMQQRSNFLVRFDKTGHIFFSQRVETHVAYRNAYLSSAARKIEKKIIGRSQRSREVLRFSIRL